MLQGELSVLYSKVSYSSVSANPVFHVRTEQIKMNYHFVTEQVAQELLYL